MANRFTIRTTFAAVDRISKPVKDIEKNIKKTGDAASQTQGKLSRMLGAAGGAARTIAVGLGAAATAAGASAVGIFKLTESVSTAGDNVAKTARYLGMTTDALQEYRYIAERSGLTTEEMDTALSKLTVNLSKDSGEISDALAMLGMSADQIKKAGPDQALNLIADGMAKITDPSRRAQIAVALFGRSGIKMTNVLAEGRAGMAALADEAHRVGYVMNSTTLDASEKLNDEILNMKTSFKAIGVQIAGQFMPLVSSAVQGITEFMVKNRDTISGVASTLVEVFKSMGPVIESVLPVVMDLFKQLGPIISKILKAAAPLINKLLQAFSKLLPPILEVVGVLADLLLPVIEMLTPVIEAVLLPILETFGRLMQMLMPLIRRLADILQNVLGKVFERLAPFLGKLAETVGGVLLKAFEAITPILTTFFDMLEPILDIALQIAEPFLAIASTLMKELAPALEKIRPLLDIVAGLLKIIMAIISPLLTDLGQVFQTVGDFIGGEKVLTADYKGRQLLERANVDTTGMTPEQIDENVKKLLQAQSGNGAFGNVGKSAEDLARQAGLPIRQAAAPVSSTTTTTSRSTVDVNFNDAPAGTTIRQSAPAPGVTVNTGTTTRRP